VARRVLFTDHAWAEYRRWQASDPRMLDRVDALIEVAAREPFGGIGKPEALRGHWRGGWSRRIDERHRLIYEAHASELVVLQCAYHYGDH
jgi:toxin YoeB